MLAPTQNNSQETPTELTQQQQALRRRAEQRLQARTITDASSDPAPDNLLLHELQLHQIELEMQNEELLASRAETEVLLARYLELYDFSPLAYFTLDPVGKILQANLTAASLLGFERAYLSKRRLGSFIEPQDLPGFNALLQQVFAGQPRSHCECRLTDPGQQPARTLHIEATLGPDGKTCHLAATDITAIKTQQLQLERLALYDAVTHLPNRVLLADRLQLAMTQCQRRGLALAVAYLDLDGFKEVNDLHGHTLGDELLLTLAQHMKDTLRKDDTLARIGGDEFVAVLVDLKQTQDCSPLLQRPSSSATRCYKSLPASA